MNGAKALVAALLLALVVGCSGESAEKTGAETTTAPNVSASSNPAAVPYPLAPTLACLRRHGLIAEPLRPLDSHLRALRDLAHRRAFQIRVGDDFVAMAFGTHVANGELLEELLTVPANPYLVERRGNLVIVRRAHAPSAYRAALACFQ